MINNATLFVSLKSTTTAIVRLQLNSTLKTTDELIPIYFIVQH